MWRTMIPRDVLKARITRIIVATRFPFVDQTDWGEGWRTVTNDGDNKVIGIEGGEGVIYPSIVSTYADGAIRVLCEVEMEDGVTEAQVPKWRLMSEKSGMGARVKKFFLYVPKGKEGVAQRLLEENDIEYAGLRTWAIREGNLVVTPVVTPGEEKDHRITGAV